MVSLEWYRTFVAIYQQGNLTKAGQELLISQPNVSVHLAALEQYVGGKLFDRMPRKMIPTELGKQLYTQVIAGVEILTSTEQTFRKNALNNQLTIKLGSPLEFFYTKLSPLLENISFQLNLTFGLAKDLVQQLSEGKLDFVIASQKSVESKHIVYEPILTENFIVVGSPDIDLKDFKKYSKGKDITAAEKWLTSQKWYAYGSDLAFIRRFWLANFNKRPKIVPQYIIPDLNTILQSISKGSKGISIVSDYLAEEFVKEKKAIVIWKGIAETSNTLYLAYDKSKVSAQKIKEMNTLIFSL